MAINIPFNYELPFNGGDIFGAWVAAGDDVLIGEYAYSSSEEGALINLVLENLAKEIDKRLNVELRSFQDSNPILFSYSAGIAMRENCTLNKMLRVVEECEKSAKFFWKKEMNKSKPQMLDKFKQIEHPHSLVDKSNL